MIKRIALVVFFFLILSADEIIAQTGKPLYTFPFGVQAYTFRRGFRNDVIATLDSIKMMGFTELEGGGGQMPPEEFKKLCNERGITIPSIGGGYDQLVRGADTIAWRAKAYGASYVMCSWIPHANNTFTLDNAKKAVEDFNKIGKTMKDNGITFCYHIHGYEFYPYEDGTLLDYIFKNTNPDYVSFEMDVFWTQFGGGDPVALLKKYTTRFKLLHVKDMRKGTPKNLTGLTSGINDVALGTGEIDLPNIIREAKKLGIKHYFIEDESDKVSEQVPQSIAYLKSLKE